MCGFPIVTVSWPIIVVGKVKKKTKKNLVAPCHAVSVRELVSMTIIIMIATGCPIHVQTMLRWLKNNCLLDRMTRSGKSYHKNHPLSCTFSISLKGTPDLNAWGDSKCKYQLNSILNNQWSSRGRKIISLRLSLQARAIHFFFLIFNSDLFHRISTQASRRADSI